MNRMTPSRSIVWRASGTTERGAARRASGATSREGGTDAETA